MNKINQGFLRFDPDGKAYLQPVTVSILPESCEYLLVDRCAPLRNEDMALISDLPSDSAIPRVKVPPQR